MDLKLTLSCILLSCLFPLTIADDVKVAIKGATLIARTDDNFVCATLDWWPSEKCDYNQCPWGEAGLFNLDLNNKILLSAIKAFNPLRLRVGGSLQDQLVYKVGNSIKKCPAFKKRNNGLFGFTRGCLQMKRWDQLNNLFNQTGALITFGLNALYGRKESQVEKGLWVGDWNSQNARDLMAYTVSKGYNIDSYEFGNELCGSGISARVEADQYGKDLIALKNLVKELYLDANTQPKVIGPGGFFDQKWFAKFLEVTGPGVVDGLTHHIYNLGAGVDSTVIDRVQDPFYLNQVAQTYKDVSRTVEEFGPWAGAWVGESGGAYNSGSKDVSHTFADGFWYLDQLGMTSTFNHKVFCRQTFIGGNYALLNTTTFTPNPDYYSALLWHRLMGKGVLSATHQGSPHLRVYSHCTRQKPSITLVLINMARSTSFNITLFNDENLYLDSVNQDSASNSNFKGYQPREEYHLTPKDGNIRSDVVLLNGTPLQLTESLDIPAMKPKLVDASSPLTVAADSIVFVTIRDFHASACA
ncbi:hypothetical protein SLE2022_340510 [Rubroshorea leprosula]